MCRVQVKLHGLRASEYNEFDFDLYEKGLNKESNSPYFTSQSGHNM